MQRVFIGLTVFFVSGCLPTSQPNQIIVDGEATLAVEPEVFSLTAAVRSRGDSHAEVLADIAGAVARIRERFPALEGLTQLSIDASAAQIIPILDRKCVDEADYRTRDACPVGGYFGAIEFAVEGAPASLSGSAISFLSELGAESVSLSRYSLIDLESAQKVALEAAVKDARTKAEKIAAASGSAISSPIRIQYGSGFSRDDYYGDQENLSRPMLDVASPETAQPEIDLNLDPQPIKIRAKVVAAFEIE
ncbi:SIMPL domain-containing protein [Hyphococcus sp.]|uniref:SIMPL domain-containing protein n=1 Tax=Hyphococcus sp. TaxID=2038636 RepID=UPI00207FE4F1|nr:MAG: hypothetical protein DHS20C04_05000 [Marinicaulis sp.]